jgi:hypothetical protein
LFAILQQLLHLQDCITTIILISLIIRHHFLRFSTPIGQQHPVLALIALYYLTFQFLKKNLYLDAGLSQKHDVAKTEDLVWLNQFGTIGTFLKMISNSSNETSDLKPP